MTAPESSPTTAPTLLADAEARLPQLLADLQRLIEVETPSRDLEAVARGAAEVADLVEERCGTRPETVVVDGVPHLRVGWGERTRVLLLCHQDTVWPVGTLARIPFDVTDGVVRGPGCFDMLTGLVMAVHAIGLLREAGGDAALDGVTLLVTGDEEVGSLSSRELILAAAEGAEAVLVLEASAQGGALKVARKGGGIYELAATGLAAHAGLEPENGVNAVLELAAQLPAVSALGDPERGTSVTPTVFTGGTTRNTVPDHASVQVDTRARTAEELERVDAGLRALQPRLAGAGLRLSGGINRPPMERGVAEDLLARYRAVTGDLGLPQPEAIEVGGCSDGNFTAGAGIPTLDGLGAVGDGAHAEHEHALVAEIAPRTAVLTGLVRSLL